MERKSSIERARRLRRDQTRVEALLWARLRDRQLLGMKFRRQVPVGPYVVDFLSWEPLLCIELDGGQHDEEADRARTACLNEHGFHVIRF